MCMEQVHSSFIFCSSLCDSHLCRISPAAIPYNTGSHRKYFTKDKEVYDIYYGYMIRCSSLWDIRHKPIMWAKMVEFLRKADSDRCAEWWEKNWQGPWTLGDCGYANCTHQNHQEGKWRPVKRGTGCGASGDERQALGSFTCQLVQYARKASEDHEQLLIDKGNPNHFVRNPTPHKKDWDGVQAFHPKIMLTTVPIKKGMTRAETEAYSELVTDIFWTGEWNDPAYLKIQNFHAEKLEAHIAAGGKEEDFKCRIRPRLLEGLIMPSIQLLYRLDPKCTRKILDVVRSLSPYLEEFKTFCVQHEESNKARVDAWDMEHYLDVMESFHVITRISKQDESFGELKFKCNCKRCYVHGCCRDSLLWSMVLNPKLIIPPKYAKREPALRKKRGRPTEKRVERLTEKQKEVDARPFVDKAPPRVSAYG